MDRYVFEDRLAAGRRLGIEVAKIHLINPVVLGLPRGGVPVAAMVAEAINAPLDVIVVRKLGVPSQPEFAMGAIGENGTRVLNHNVIRASNVSEQALQAVESRERNELDRRLRAIRSVRPRESLVGCAAVIVDDGIATGATMRAAIDVAKASGATTVIVATPVAPPDVVADLRSKADRVICLEEPEPFWAVGTWYRRFDAVSDAEVAEVLSSHVEQATIPCGQLETPPSAPDVGAL